MRTPTKPISLIDKKVNPLSTLQDPFDILRHDIADAVDLAPRRGERVRRWRRVVCLQEAAEFPVKGCAAVGWERGEVRARGWVGGQELPLHL